ncbi:MAG: FkbM family methyltransferase [Magnetospirillum sp. WYHS-4]
MTIATLLQPFRPLRIMDVGAMPEGKPRYAPLLESGGATVDAFEPDPRSLARLREQAPEGYRYHGVFLGDGDDHDFHITRYPGCSSLFAPDPTIIDAFMTIGTGTETGNFGLVRKERVATTRLDDVPGLAPPDLMKLDVQGAELLVLQHGKRTLASAAVVEIEVEFLPLYRGQPLFDEVFTFMREQGFVLHKLIDVAGRTLRPIVGPNRFLPLSQVLWSDAVFVRSYFDLEGWSLDTLTAAAIVLGDVYRSFDVVFRLVTELDRREGSARIVRLAAELKSAGDLNRLYFNERDTP